jgi:large conductance mechanosensitive channel
MPLVGSMMGGFDFSSLAIKVGGATIKYGNFIQTCVNFLIIAWAIFLMVKVINRLKRDEEKPAEQKEPPRQEVLLEEIRDLLKKR